MKYPILKLLFYLFLFFIASLLHLPFCIAFVFLVQNLNDFVFLKSEFYTCYLWLFSPFAKYYFSFLSSSFFLIGAKVTSFPRYVDFLRSYIVVSEETVFFRGEVSFLYFIILPISVYIRLFVNRVLLQGQKIFLFTSSKQSYLQTLFNLLSLRQRCW